MDEGIKISELDLAESANENDLLYIVQDGESKAIEAKNIGTGGGGRR